MLWRQACSNNLKERLKGENRARTDVVGTLPDHGGSLRPIGTALADCHEQWAAQRRYMGTELLLGAFAQDQVSEAEREG